MRDSTNNVTLVGGECDGRIVALRPDVAASLEVLNIEIPFRCGAGRCWAIYQWRPTVDRSTLTHVESRHRKDEDAMRLASDSFGWERSLCREWAASPEGQAYIAQRKQQIPKETFR